MSLRTGGPHMDRVYLSYIEQDREAAQELAQTLETYRLNVSHGGRDIPAGDPSSEAVRRARFVIVLCSRASLKSPYILADAKIGLERGVLMLVSLEDLGPDDLPSELREQRVITVDHAEAIFRELSLFASPVLPQASNDALYRKRMEADDVPTTIESATGAQADRDELYRSRIEADDVPPTIGSAPAPAPPPPAQDELYRSRIAEDDPPTLASAPVAAARGIFNDRLPLDRLAGWMTARDAALRGVLAHSIPASYAPRQSARPEVFADLPPPPGPVAAPPPPAEARPEAATAPPPPRPRAPSVGASPPSAKGSTGTFGLAIFAALGIAVAYLFVGSPLGRDVLDKLVAMVGIKLNAFSFLGFLSRRKAVPPPVLDTVDCSVFSPPSAPAGSTVLVQVFLHIPEQAARAQFMASVMDQAATLKGVQTLKVPVARGSSVTVTLSGDGLGVDEPQQAVVWRGEPVFCQFLVSLPEGSRAKSFHSVVRIAVDGGLVGRIVFALSASPDSAAPQSVPQGTSARRYNHAFLSYASPDRKEVLKRAQILQAAGVSFFQDTLKLDPGTRWEKEIYRNIDGCDLFLLFWSKAALDSEWVIKEAEYALKRQGVGDMPDIVPVILEDPPLPPPSLAAIHFNDRIHYLIAAN